MRRPALARWALLGVALGCGLSTTETYRVHGVVRAVAAAERQIQIAHEEIPGFMPAMTMSFDVARPELLEGVEAGDRVRFELERSATRLRITALEVVGRSGGVVVEIEGLAPLGPGAPAPDFQLVGQDGALRTLSELRGRVVLLDFVFTRCPGPCPILTSSHVTLQRLLPAEVAARTRFLSVSLDPAWDTPERLREYGAARGVVFDRWDFLTGEPEVVQRVLDAYGVGSVRRPDGTLDHVIVTYLIDPEGRIAERFLGLEHEPQEVLDALVRLLS